MAKRNNIVLCANDVTQIGGISRVLHSMAEGFSNNGYNVTLLGMNSIEPERSYSDRSDKSRRYRVVIPYSGQPPARRTDPELWNRMRGEAVGYMRAFLDSINISDTIFITLHVYVMEHLLETGIQIGGENGLAVVGMYHSSFEACEKSGDLKRVHKAYGKANRFLALTEQDRDRYAATGMGNVSFIYNPVELLSRPPEKSWIERNRSVVYMGRFARGKNIPWLVEAWSKVARDFPDWHFDIYGVGPDENEIANAIMRNQVTMSARIMGISQSPEAVFADSRIMLMASDFEGLPVVVVEAGLCSVPTVSTDSYPGVGVLIEDGVTGYVATHGDIDSYVARLRKLMGDSDLNRKMGESAKKHMEKFSIPKVMEDWERIFLSCGI